MIKVALMVGFADPSHPITLKGPSKWYHGTIPFITNAPVKKGNTYHQLGLWTTVQPAGSAGTPFQVIKALPIRYLHLLHGNSRPAARIRWEEVCRASWSTTCDPCKGDPPHRGRPHTLPVPMLISRSPRIDCLSDFEVVDAFFVPVMASTSTNTDNEFGPAIYASDESEEAPPYAVNGASDCYVAQVSYSGGCLTSTQQMPFRGLYP